MQKQNYIRFIFLLVLSAIEIFSGFVLWLALPRGGEGFRGGRGILASPAEFLLLERQQWLSLHDWIGVALIVVVVAHLIVHRRWIVYMTRKLLRSSGGRTASVTVPSGAGNEELLSKA